MTILVLLLLATAAATAGVSHKREKYEMAKESYTMYFLLGQIENAKKCNISDHLKQAVTMLVKYSAPCYMKHMAPCVVKYKVTGSCLKSLGYRPLPRGCRTSLLSGLVRLKMRYDKEKGNGTCFEDLGHVVDHLLRLPNKLTTLSRKINGV